MLKVSPGFYGLYNQSILQHGNCIFWAVAGEEEKENCLKLAKKLGEKVHVHGAVPQKKLAEILRHSHILVLPSFFEGLPLVILEGLASGCRVVATDLPGAEELLGHSSAEFITLYKDPAFTFYRSTISGR